MSPRIASRPPSRYARAHAFAFYRRTFQLVTAAILGYALYQASRAAARCIGWAVVLAFILYPLQGA